MSNNIRLYMLAVLLSVILFGIVYFDLEKSFVKDEYLHTEVKSVPADVQDDSESAVQPTVLPETENISSPACGADSGYGVLFRCTAYCGCRKCCGKSDGITASGTIAEEGRTVGVDTSVIPLGATVIIAGNVYIAEDTGGAIKGNQIDIYFDSHEEALAFGVKYLKVEVIENGGS